MTLSTRTSRLLTFSWIAVGFILILTFGAYIANFKTQDISSDPAHWGQIGDYIGGILNPILSLITLVVVSYISLEVAASEEKRNQFTLQELARPLGAIICGDYENLLKVKFKNCGLGPLIIKEIVISRAGQKIHNNLRAVMPDSPDGIMWDDFMIDGVGLCVAKDSSINVLRLTGELTDPAFCKYRTNVRKALQDLTIEIRYEDIYGRPMKSAIRQLDLFGRTLKQIK